MNEQDVFNTVVTHLRQQGCPAKSTSNSCAYRGTNGTKCAIGCLITDEEYSPSMEGCSVFILLGSPNTPDSLREKILPFTKKYDYSASVSSTMLGDLGLLPALQTIHDTLSPENWESRFVKLAQARKLTMPPIEWQQQSLFDNL